MKKGYSKIPYSVLILIASCSAVGSEKSNTVGVGVGLPFGGLGVNYERQINDYYAFTIGLGALPDNIGYLAGFRLYYPKPDSKFRGRLSVLYGVNTIEQDVHSDDYETQTGFSAGPGLSWRFNNNWAFDADLFFVDNDVSEGYLEKGSSAKLSLGFRRFF